ncbi:type I restriction modification DNA specificity domain-containing protein [Bifidobacterium lemurum]|uniref:Type I restriction modification DNA specificity domain-containing protein n=1 Tax=Bifidobacterium lemurum TaxID=1603886 RepID=A0A261FWJ0_9BIFI|nr:restriction endonuclease subunit S [Bifidobacterium lemurum]OZG63527.1 type I restriction modification DNA specificity domain-containing protein [Bifidobacterium lemurum]QOL34431.1 restriction endonuclease subunit S [Bifidobacterium lemurum]
MMDAKTLRNAILQAAVRGKLVEQDESEGTADELLERIRTERAELIKQKKIKAPRGGESHIYHDQDGHWYEQKGKTDPICIDKDIPFDIPDNWTWARLKSITTYIQRGKSPKYSLIEKYPVVAQKCNQWSGFSLEKAKFVDPETIEKYDEERILLTGDLLWNSTGLGTLGRMAVYDSNLNPYGWAVADSHVTVIRTRSHWSNYWYLFSYFAGPSVQNVIEEQSSGTTKQKELALSTVQDYLIPLPPFAEQQRIVNKINELTPLIDDYGKVQELRNKLDAELPDTLRKSVLQAAVQGKLVEQDESEGTADELLERIRAERAELIKQKKIKAPRGGESHIYHDQDGHWYEQKGKTDPICIDKDIPFDIPDNWTWARLGAIAVIERGSGIKRDQVMESGYPCIRYGELYTTYTGMIRECSSHTNKEVFDKSHHLLPNELLATLTGENDIDIGRAAINKTDKILAYGSDLAGIKFHHQNGDYLCNLLNSPFVNSQRTSAANGKIIVHISASAISAFLIPIPPLAEQQRIVNKIAEVNEQIGTIRQ